MVTVGQIERLKAFAKKQKAQAPSSGEMGKRYWEGYIQALSDVLELM